MKWKRVDEVQARRGIFLELHPDNIFYAPSAIAETSSTE
jgi:hypothetical protein